MIGSLRGNVVERLSDGSVLLEVGGVGYSIQVTPRTLAELEPTSPAFLYVHHHIREDAQTLFGFLQRDERQLFQTLIAAHGVGPAMAMSILATHSPRALVDIVASSDLAALTLVPGVGKKTAERLLVELRGKLSLSSPAEVPGASSVTSEVRQALLGLGYTETEVRDVLREAGPHSAGDSAELLRWALSFLGAHRA
jgi:Holliday junction DNA helicase RuvA